MREQFKSKISRISPSFNPELQISDMSVDSSPEKSLNSSKFQLSLLAKTSFLSFATLLFFTAYHIISTNPASEKIESTSGFLQTLQPNDPAQRILELEHKLIFDLEGSILEWTIPRDIKIDGTVEFEIICEEDISSWFSVNPDRSKFIIKERTDNYHNVSMILKGFMANGLSYQQRLTICTRKVMTVLRTIAPEFKIADGDLPKLPETLVLKDRNVFFGWSDPSRIHFKEYSLDGKVVNENSFNIHEDESPIYFKMLKFGDADIFAFYIKKSNPLAFNYVIYNLDLLAIGARENINSLAFNRIAEDQNFEIINIINNRILIVYEAADYELKGMRIATEKPEGVTEFSIDKSSCHKKLSVSLLASFEILIVWTTCENTVNGVVVNLSGEKTTKVFDFTEDMVDYSKIISYKAISNKAVVFLTHSQQNSTNFICPVQIHELEHVKKSNCIKHSANFVTDILDENRIVYIGLEENGDSSIVILPIAEKGDFFTDSQRSCEISLSTQKTNSDYLPSIFSGGIDKTILCWESAESNAKCFFITQNCHINEYTLKSYTGEISGVQVKSGTPQTNLFTYKTYPNPLLLNKNNLVALVTGSTFEKAVVPEATNSLRDKTFYIFMKDTYVFPSDLFFGWDSGPLTYNLVMANAEPLPSWMTYEPDKMLVFANPAFITFSEQFDLIYTATNRFGISVSVPLTFKVQINLLAVTIFILMKVLVTYCICKVWKRCRGHKKYKSAKTDETSQKSIVSEGGIPIKKLTNYNEFKDEFESNQSTPVSDGSRLQPVMIPDHFFCPLTKYIMAYPYDAFSGEELVKTTYEKSAIVDSYSKNKQDPVTKMFIYKKSDNLPLRVEIETFLKKVRSEQIFRDDFLRDNVKFWISERGKDNLVRNPMLASIVYEYLQATKE